ncbi:MAG: hypothetical protein FP810_13585 [Desulfocapsa sp.]|nr:hypothetical protein [Desulfocapsa sp.]
MVRGSAQIVMLILLTASLTGCEPQTRHQALNFFFTGVPPLNEESAPAAEIQEPATPPPAANIAKKPVPSAPKPLFSHPVWVAGTCTPCHESTGVFRTPGAQKSSPHVFKTGGGMPGKLTLPKNELCIQCHKDKTPRRAMADNLWLHNTVAKGDCLSCHDPHQSNIANTLRQAPSIICLPCHKEGKFLATSVHQKGEECLSCHNPHMGIDKNILTKEYKEIKMPVVLVPGDQVPDR